VTVVFVGLGANLGDPREALESALQELDRLPHTRLVRRSSFYRSAPLGYAEQPDFLNAVAQLETALPAERLLGELQAIEARHGRSRSFANAPRALDLDLLLFGKVVLETPALTLPHPRMHERAFVLQPLVEIAPDTVIPSHGPAARLLEGCKNQSVEKLGGG
jgi:2-amino-4-hydroxy-6-hydroxymethyldihydropteridine diphosphokinase